ncbi:MAG: carbohydrate ABC transporter permease [Propionibacteriaceae bacterium]|jgi:ABC-type glycerol-3-phosphate transport system permease component|nr:carbohydrate ABC transporter permease [Propionibacteriaceae bacterium]
MRLPNRIGSSGPRRLVVAVATWAVGLAFAAPLLWILINSLRRNDQIFTSTYPLSWRSFLPQPATWANYELVLTGQFGRSVLNSLLVTVIAIVVGLFISALAAYALAVLRFRGASFVFSVVVLGFLIPFDAVAVPLSNLFRSWGLANTYSGLILPGLASGFAIFILRQFFAAIPYELTEAARLDGLGWWGVFWRIHLPLSRPALIGAGFTIFLFEWDSYLWPLLIATDPSMVLGPIALTAFNGQYKVEFGAIFAGSVLLTAVPMVLLLFFQRYFTASLTTTGSKG